MFGWWVDGAILFEDLPPFREQNTNAGRVHGDGIQTHQKPLVRPGVFRIEVMRADSVKLRGEDHQNIEAGLALDLRQFPDLGEVRTGVAVVGLRFRDKHDVVLEETPNARPVVGSQRPHIDERRGLLKVAVAANPPIVGADVLLAHTGGDDPLLDRQLQRGRCSKVTPDIRLDADDIVGFDDSLPGLLGIRLVEQGADRSVKHFGNHIRLRIAVRIEYVFIADQDNPRLLPGLGEYGSG